MRIIDSFNFRLWIGSSICGLFYASSNIFFSTRVLFQLIDFLSIYFILNFSFGFLIHFLSAYFIYSISKFPGNKSIGVIFPITFLWTFLLVLFYKYLLNYTSSTILIFILFLISTSFSFIGFTIRTKKNLIFAYIPLGRNKKVYKLSEINWLRLDKPILPSTVLDAIVVDLHTPELTNEWQKFLAECTLSGIPVYNIRQLEESLTGRIRITHMYENDLGSLLPSPVYILIKRILESILIIFSLPFTLPLMIITAILIKFEDRGPIFYNQIRVGYQCRPFRMYKFRSMTVDKNLNNHQITTKNDQRVTKIGRYIRKLRIDELPQFFNVLKGEMALIGPRAEFKKFADELEKTVPFYQYRHIVKPGITGWAQVMHGYATGSEETQTKIEYDFYYIKNFSFSLDVLIVFKTIKTMLTGFGAR